MLTNGIPKEGSLFISQKAKTGTSFGKSKVNQGYSNITKHPESMAFMNFEKT